ncbi:MAG: sulfatase-like hydrolase/transferase [Pseudomonadales bacterium]
MHMIPHLPASIRKLLQNQRTALLVAAILIVLLQGCEGQRTKPNVLVILLDDFGYNDLAINNSSDSPTPTLDSIALSGMRFTRHYTESSCSPTRAALLTGLYPARLGFHPNGTGIAHEVDTLPDVLAANGYATHMIGKWHTGDTHREARPEYQGFQHWFGFINQLYLAGPDSKGEYRSARPTYRNPWLETEAGDLQQHKGHLTDILTRRALQVMSAEQRPWFMYLAFYAPHTPLQPATRFARRFEDTKRGKYQALKAQVDSSINEIRQQLAASGELENTIMVVLGDNGGTAKHYPSNLPFVGEKVFYREGGVRTPLMMSWPAQWAAQQSIDKIVSVIDIFPTLLAALNIEAPEKLDGVDILKSVPKRRLFWYSHSIHGDQYSVLSADGQWRLNHFFTQPLVLTSEANFTLTDAPNERSRAPEIGEQLSLAHQNWRDDATINRLHANEQTDKIQSYVRDAFRRTPIAYTHTLGLGFRVNRPASFSAAQQPLAYQKGYLSYAYNPASEELTVEVDGQRTVIKVALDANACHSLVVASDLHKSNMVYFERNLISDQSIFVDGQLLKNFTYHNPLISKASPQNALVVNTDRDAAVYMPAAAKPVISSRALNRNFVSTQLHPELLAACANSQAGVQTK